MPFITHTGYCERSAKLRKLREELANLYQTRGTTCKQASSDHIADAEHQAYHESERLLQSQIRVLENEMQCEPAPEAKSCGKAFITNLVTLEDLDGPAGNKVKYHIVGHGEGDPSTTPPRLAYDSPLGEALLGLSIGDEAYVEHSGKSYLVLEIDLPPQQESDAPPLLRVVNG